MKLSTNFIRFYNEFDMKSIIDIFSEAGFESMDFNTCLQEYYSDAHDKDFYLEIRDYANSKGIEINQSHAPFGSKFADEEKSKQRFDEIVKSMEHSSWLGVDMVVIHPCNHIDYVAENKFDYMLECNYDFYKKLIPYAENYGVKIAIENIVKSITQTPEGLLKLINELDNDVFTVCYDVGHANICGIDYVDMIKKIGSHIGCTHIHDNDGVSDGHTLPYYGTIDWEKVMQAFAEIDYKGNLSYEAGLFIDKVPVVLRPESAKYMATVGKHLIERFEYYKK